ncbi:MAG: alpha/beta hydrolase [Alphaproteobacteria bacterium]
MPVYRDYDQAELDAQYNNRAAVPGYARWSERWPVASAEARQHLAGRLDVPYGAAAAERLDIFPAARPQSPVLLFIHGGYWRANDKSSFSFVASGYVEAGVSVVAVGYPLAPRVTLDALTESIRRAVGWVHRNAGSFGADPARIHVSGHSAGGHLTAMMLSTEWTARGLPGDVVKGGAAISGIYDLEPIRLSYLNADVRLDAAMAERNSPLLLVPDKAAALILTVGGRETDEFRRQQEIYGEAWHGAGLPLELVPMPEDQHFSILDAFAAPASPLFSAVLRQIGSLGS